MPQIIKIDGLYKLPSDILEKSNEKRFDYIFEKGIWERSTKGESVSGSGSTIQNTILYRNQLKSFLGLYKNKKPRFFDAPCGDLNWIKEFFNNVDYIGGDISGDLIKNLKKKYPKVELKKFDIIKDIFPKADVWHCRHCLFHLSLSDVVKALDNFCNSNIEQALITNHFLPDSITFDIPSGSFRFLDLTNYPFYIPKPKFWLLDSDPLSGKVSMAAGFWSKAQLNQGIANYNKFMKY
jgi:hypothetical protein|tara:strand:+ start:280 stop:990 length:711 start_codon:yes stop_codon:yes gene_type:complete